MQLVHEAAQELLGVLEPGAASAGLSLEVGGSATGTLLLLTRGRQSLPRQVLAGALCRRTDRPSQQARWQPVLTPLLLSTQRLVEARGPSQVTAAVKWQSRGPYCVHLMLLPWSTASDSAWESGGGTVSNKVTLLPQGGDTGGRQGAPVRRKVAWKEWAHRRAQLSSAGSTATCRHPGPCPCFSLLPEPCLPLPSRALWQEYRVSPSCRLGHDLD